MPTTIITLDFVPIFNITLKNSIFNAFFLNSQHPDSRIAASSLGCMVNTTKMEITSILHHGSQHELEQRMDCLFFEFAFVSLSCREQSNSRRGKKDNKPGERT